MSGQVTAVLAPTTGVLSIVGDKANNSITIGASPILGDIRVSGNVKLSLPPTVPPTLPDVTSVNGVAYTDFVASSITSINVNMKDGNDTVLVNPSGTAALTIGGNLTIVLGAGTDTVTTRSIVANQVSVSAAGPGADAISLTNTKAGSLNIAGGTGVDAVALNGGVIGTALITTAASKASGSISVQNFPSSPTKPGIGLLSILAGDGNTSIAADNLVAGQVSLRAGSGTNTIDASGDTVNGGGGLSITAGLGGSSIQAVTVSGDSIPNGNLAVSLGDGPAYYSPSPSPIGTLLPGSSLILSKDAVGKAANIGVGANFRTVTIGSDNATNPVSAASLRLTVGGNEDLVTLNTRVAGAETVTAGNFETYPNRPVPAPRFSLAGTAGSLGLTVGDNASTVSQAASVGGNETVVIGNGNAGGSTIARSTAGSTSVSLLNNTGGLTVTGPGGTTSTDTITVGNNAAAINVSGSVGYFESITVGNNAGSINVSSGVLLDESIAVGDNAGPINVSGSAGRNENLTVGINASTVNISSAVSNNLTVKLGGASAAAPATLNISGPVAQAESVAVGDNTAVNVTSPTVGSETVTAGANASVVIGGVKSSGDVNVTVGDDAAYVEVMNTSSAALSVTGGAGNAGAAAATVYALVNDVVTNGMTLTFGDGNNIAELIGMDVSNGLFVTGGAGINTVYVQNTAADYGVIYGGSSGLNNYYDLGGNFPTWAITGFIGYTP